jgi:hypothetical protein
MNGVDSELRILGQLKADSVTSIEWGNQYIKWIELMVSQFPPQCAASWMRKPELSLYIMY